MGVLPVKNLAIGSMSHLIEGLRILQAYSEYIVAEEGAIVIYCHTKPFEEDNKKLHLMGWSNHSISYWEYYV